MVNISSRSVERKAFTLIELIFAIVIIGLVALSIPALMINNSRNVEQNLLQEAVLVAVTKAGQILTFPWDENSNPTLAILSKSDVLDVNNSGTATLARVGTTDFRVGHFQESLRRKMAPNSFRRYASGTLGADGGDFDDIDDINGISQGITGGGIYGYKYDYNVTGNVVYIDDTYVEGNTITYNFPTADIGTDTNIKMVEISVKKGNIGEVTNWGAEPNVVVFRTYSSNIGEIDYHKRTY